MIEHTYKSKSSTLAEGGEKMGKTLLEMVRDGSLRREVQKHFSSPPSDEEMDFYDDQRELEIDDLEEEGGEEEDQPIDENNGNSSHHNPS